MVEAFRTFDLNRSGYLEYDELRAALSHYGIDVSSQAARGVLLHYDSSHDGRLDMEEFSSVIRDILLAQPLVDPGEHAGAQPLAGPLTEPACMLAPPGMLPPQDVGRSLHPVPCTLYPGMVPPEDVGRSQDDSGVPMHGMHSPRAVSGRQSLSVQQWTARQQPMMPRLVPGSPASGSPVSAAQVSLVRREPSKRSANQQVAPSIIAPWQVRPTLPPISAMPRYRLASAATKVAPFNAIILQAQPPQLPPRARIQPVAMPAPSNANGTKRR